MKWNIKCQNNKHKTMKNITIEYEKILKIHFAHAEPLLTFPKI